MISLDQFKLGLTAYVVDNIAPAVADPLKKFGLCCAAELAIKNIEQNPIVSALGVVHDGKVDIDGLYSVARKYACEPLPVAIPLIGEFRFKQTDIDTIYKTITSI